MRAIFREHAPLYRIRKPAYQAQMLADLREAIPSETRSILDVGCGTGLVAHAMRELFALDAVRGIDVVDRVFPSVRVPFAKFDGEHIPADDGAVDVVTILNVMHHVPEAQRVGLLRECLRVARSGTVVVKDHIAESSLDHARLTTLDAIGNVPFSGMVYAKYLGERAWRRLIEDAGGEITRTIASKYRRGLSGIAFPNRLEVVFVVRKR